MIKQRQRKLLSRILFSIFIFMVIISACSTPQPTTAPIRGNVDFNVNKNGFKTKANPCTLSGSGIYGGVDSSIVSASEIKYHHPAYSNEPESDTSLGTPKGRYSLSSDSTTISFASFSSANGGNSDSFIALNFNWDGKDYSTATYKDGALIWAYDGFFRLNFEGSSGSLTVEDRPDGKYITVSGGGQTKPYIPDYYAPWNYGVYMKLDSFSATFKVGCPEPPPIDISVSPSSPKPESTPTDTPTPTPLPTPVPTPTPTPTPVCYPGVPIQGLHNPDGSQACCYPGEICNIGGSNPTPDPNNPSPPAPTPTTINITPAPTVNPTVNPTNTPNPKITPDPRRTPKPKPTPRVNPTPGTCKIDSQQSAPTLINDAKVFSGESFFDTNTLNSRQKNLNQLQQKLNDLNNPVMANSMNLYDINPDESITNNTFSTQSNLSPIDKKRNNLLARIATINEKISNSYYDVRDDLDYLQQNITALSNDLYSATNDVVQTPSGDTDTLINDLSNQFALSRKGFDFNGSEKVLIQEMLLVKSLMTSYLNEFPSTAQKFEQIKKLRGNINSHSQNILDITDKFGDISDQKIDVMITALHQEISLKSSIGNGFHTQGVDLLDPVTILQTAKSLSEGERAGYLARNLPVISRAGLVTVGALILVEFAVDKCTNNLRTTIEQEQYVIEVLYFKSLDNLAKASKKARDKKKTKLCNDEDKLALDLIIKGIQALQTELEIAYAHFTDYLISLSKRTAKDLSTNEVQIISDIHNHSAQYGNADSRINRELDKKNKDIDKECECKYKDVQPPSDRHYLNRISLVKDKNTIFTLARNKGDVLMLIAKDLEEIRDCSAEFDGNNFTTSSGRIYGYEVVQNGRGAQVYPISGDGIEQLNRAEYDMLVQFKKSGLNAYKYAENKIRVGGLAQQELYRVEIIARFAGFII